MLPLVPRRVGTVGGDEEGATSVREAGEVGNAEEDEACAECEAPRNRTFLEDEEETSGKGSEEEVSCLFARDPSDCESEGLYGVSALSTLSRANAGSSFLFTDFGVSLSVTTKEGMVMLLSRSSRFFSSA